MGEMIKRSDLFKAIISLSNESECEAFFKDLCTPSEIRAMTERWEIARLLSVGTLSYRQISAQTGASTTTIGRVARFLDEDGSDGYRQILEKTSAQQ